MAALQERYVTDHEGNRIGVFLGMEEYQHLLDRLEEMEDIQAYDESKATGGEVIPFDQAMAEIDQNRR
jgi:hypothetical protein